MKIFGKLVIATASVVVCAATANAQAVTSENNEIANVAPQNKLEIKSTENKVVRYSAGESIPLGYPAVKQKSKSVEIEKSQESLPKTKMGRYSAGESIPLGEPSRNALGYSGSSSIPLAGALGDSVTTHIGLSQAGLAEQNGLINTSPAGLVGLFVIKAGIIYYFDNQESKLRKTGLKASAGVWSGVTMNNLLLIAGSSNPVGLVGGALFGAYMYHREGISLEKEEAARYAQRFTVQAK